MIEYPHKVQPWPHQKRIFEETRDEVMWALFMEMRTGKTKIIIDTVVWNYLHKRITGAIVIAKKGEYSNWPLIELPEHMPDGVEWDSCLFTGYQVMTKKGRAQFEAFLGKEALRWLVINKEAMGTKRTDQAIADFIEACPKFALIIDESTCVKHHKAKQSKAVYEVRSQATLRRIMTGTSITEGPLDIFGQAMALGSTRELLGHSSWFSFRNEYAIIEVKTFGPRSFKTITGYKNIEKLKRVISKFSTQVSRDDVLKDLPPKIYKKKIVELTDEQRRLYESVRDEAMAEFGEGQIVKTTNAMGTLMKLHQIVCGQLRLDDGTYHSIPNNRIEATLDLLEHFKGKALIWTNYRQSIMDMTQAIKDKFGEDSCDAYYGGVPQDERDAMIAKFQGVKGKGIEHDPKFRFIVANQQALGYGRTLTRASLEIYAGNAFKLEHRLQSEDRPVGAGNQIYVVDLITPGTVDERIFELLKKKQDMSQAIVRSSFRDWVF